MKDNNTLFGNARFQFMTDRLIRAEWSVDGVFEDRPTLAVINREFPAVTFTKEEADDTLLLKSDGLILTYKNDGKPFSPDNLKIQFLLNNEQQTWTLGMDDELNLGSTIRTLDGVDGAYCHKWLDNPDYEEGAEGEKGKKQIRKRVLADLGKGLLSRSGWAVVDDSRNIVMDKVDGYDWIKERPGGERQDLYFFGYGRDYKAALKDGAELFGRQPLPPRYSFGYWWSRYWAYSDEQIEELVDSFDSMNVPIDVMVVDMDWHLEGWTGYTWDRRYFPDPDEFLARMRERGLKTTLNLHPADGVGKHEEQFEIMAKEMGVDPEKADKVEFNITDPKYMNAYFKHLHHPDERRGIDFWWMDWQQGETTAMKGLDTLPWINHLHWHDMANNPERGDKRPLIFSRFGGIGAGRYAIGFSGDTYSNWDSLKFQPYFTATASNVLYGYWSHDIGGHMPGEIEPELYTRWIQYGVYSPCLRTHTTKNSRAERRIWEYPDPYNKVMMDTVRLRYELVPYIYSESRKAFDTGISLCRPMYYDYPELDEAYAARDQYMFGDEMLVAPVIDKAHEHTRLAKVSIWLPEGEWLDTARGKLESGGQTIEREYLIDEVPVFVRPGAIIPGQRNVDRLNDASIKDLVLTIYGGTEGSYSLYEDDGDSTGYEEDKCVKIDISHKASGSERVVRIAPVTASYDGFVATKSLEIRIACSVPAKSVTVGGKALDWSFRLGDTGWTYDGKTGTVILRIAEVDLAAGVEVTVVSADEDAKHIDGLKGRMARLNLVNYWNTLSTTAHILHQDERLGIELAQTGNRISRWPETFQKEMENLEEKFAGLKQMLSELSDRTGRWEKENPERRQNCETAITVLDSIQQS